MKVLFVCRGNVGRSQMAQSFYRWLYHEEAGSAGTMVGTSGQLLKDRTDDTTATLITAMKEVGIDMSENVRTQLTLPMIEAYDKVIVMVEPENTPDWLRDHPKTERWEIADPLRIPLAETRVIRDEIKRRISKLMPETAQSRR